MIGLVAAISGFLFMPVAGLVWVFSAGGPAEVPDGQGGILRYEYVRDASECVDATHRLLVTGIWHDDQYYCAIKEPGLTPGRRQGGETPWIVPDLRR